MVLLKIKDIIFYFFTLKSRIISGGNEGEVRVWKIGKQTQIMEASMKEHRGRVWAIQV
jgi:cilia- and flagella-associated protein 52